MTETSFIRLVRSPWTFGWFLFRLLPAAWFMRLRVAHLDASRAEVTLPYGWRSRNPFRSTYFAAQCAAGEMATGLLAMLAMQGKPPVSMLVVHLEAEFLKKATTTLRFTCTEGELIRQILQECQSTGEARQLRMTATGRLPDGTEAARVYVTWSFKKKSSPSS